MIPAIPDTPVFHAQVLRDGDALFRIRDTKDLNDHDAVILGAMLSRYGGIGTGLVHNVLVHQVVEAKGLTVQALNHRCRQIWASGYRPPLETEEVGSGSDVNSEESA